MKAKVMNLQGKEGKELTLPTQFEESFRPDLIKKAVLAIQSHKIQPTGTTPRAGLRSSAYLSKRRKRYRGTYGPGRSRTPRKILTRRGLHFYYVGAVVPNTVGGRTAHPAKASKDWNLKINKKERRKAIRSAIAATMDQNRVTKRGHKVQSIVIDSEFEKVAKAKDVKSLLLKLGFDAEMKRTSIKKIRAGKGKNRGRPYKNKIGPLIVISDKAPIVKAARNFRGVDVCHVKSLNAELLAPGTDAGRVTIWSDKAIEIMEKEKLYY